MPASAEKIDRSCVTAVVLAGGRATRMGGQDKGLIEIDGIPMCQIVIDALRPQVAEVVVSANRNLSAYRNFGVRTVEDSLPGYLGPLAGFASAMRAAHTPWIISAPCDCPSVSHDYVARMSAIDSAEIDVVVAGDGRRWQPTFMMARCDLVSSIEEFLAAGERKIDRWFTRLRYRLADFSETPNLFENINTPQEHGRAQRRIRSNDD